MNKLAKLYTLNLTYTCIEAKEKAKGMTLKLLR